MNATSATNLAPAHPDETRDLAYQIWAFRAGRNAAEVARLLAADGAMVPERTVQHWAKEYEWSARAERDMHAIAPDIRYQTFGELVFGGLDGARYIRRVAGGQEDHANIDDILADDDLGYKEKQLAIDARIRGHDAARKARITASIAAVDRVGFSPVSKGIPSVDPPTSSNETIELQSLVGLSPDELMRAEEAARSRKR